jgi:hypothetical protein
VLKGCGDVMSNVTIVYSNGDVAIFDIYNEKYYFVFKPGLPKVFDKNLNIINTSNVDKWVAAKTRNIYNLEMLTAISEAFFNGVKSAYSLNDFKSVLDRTIEFTIKKVARSEELYNLCSSYWVEILTVEEVEDLIRKIKERIDSNNYKPEAIAELLCRLYKICNIRQMNGSDTATSLLERIGRDLKDPKYPSVNEIKSRIVDEIIQVVLSSLVQDKIPGNLIDKVNILQKMPA